MRSAGVVEAEIPADRGAGLGDRVVSSEVDLLVLDRSPEPLDEDVEAPGTLAVHASGFRLLERSSLTLRRSGPSLQALASSVRGINRQLANRSAWISIGAFLWLVRQMIDGFAGPLKRSPTICRSSASPRCRHQWPISCA